MSFPNMPIIYIFFYYINDANIMLRTALSTYRNEIWVTVQLKLEYIVNNLVFSWYTYSSQAILWIE